MMPRRDVRALCAALYLPAFLLIACAPASAQCIRYEDYTHPVGMLRLDASIYGVAVAGPFAYLIDFNYEMTSTFHVIDIADPSRPAPVSSLAIPMLVPPIETAVANSLVLVSDYYNGQLYVIDVANPQVPRLTGTLAIQNCNDVAVAGSFAFVAGDAFHTVDISDPADPEIVASMDVTGYYVALSGRYAFVGGGETGLIVLDISDPIHPAMVTTLPVPGEAGPVSISGGHAYLIDYAQNQETLRVVDISDPRHPRLQGSVPAIAATVTALETMVCLTYPWRGVTVVDVTDPENPAIAEYHEFPYWSATVVAVDAGPIPRGPRIFVGGWGTYDLIGYWGWFAAFDESKLHEVQNLGTIDLPCRPAGLDVSESHGYVAGSGCGLQVIDIEDPHHPMIAGTADTPGNAYDVDVAGQLAHVADGTSGLHVIDVSDPRAPEIRGSVDTPGLAMAVEVDGPYAFVADREGGLQVIDVSDPAVPRVAGSVDTPGEARDVAISGECAYIADGFSGLQVISIADPDQPSIVGSLDMSGFFQSVAVSGHFAYVAADSWGLYVIDVADPTAPRLVGSLPIPPGSTAGRVAVTQKDVYLTVDSAIQLIDVSDPATPRIKGTLPLDDLPAYAMAVSASLLLVGVGGENRLIAFPSQCEPTVGPGIRGPVRSGPALTAWAWPNPMTSGTTVRLAMPAPGPVRAGVWDVSGRLVRTLHDGTLRAGIQDLTWDGCGPDGRPVAAGIYWIRIDGSTESTAQRLLVLK